LGELDDARVAASGVVPVADEDVAVGRDGDRVRLIERVGPIARDAGLTERQKRFSIGTEFPLRVPLAFDALTVGDPQVAVLIDRQTVREDEHAAAPTSQHLARRVELEDGIELGIPARVHAATLGDPDVSIARDCHAARRSHRAAFGELVPVLNRTVWIRLRVWRGICLRQYRRNGHYQQKDSCHHSGDDYTPGPRAFAHSLCVVNASISIRSLTPTRPVFHKESKPFIWTKLITENLCSQLRPYPNGSESLPGRYACGPSARKSRQSRSGGSGASAKVNSRSGCTARKLPT